MSDPEKYEGLVGKILVVVVLLGIGFAFIGNGIIIFTTNPFMQDHHPFETNVKYGDKTSLHIKFNSDEYGLRAHRNIEAGITVYIHEIKTNSANIEVEFPRANIIIEEIHDYELKEGKTVVLNYINTDHNNISQYNANPILIYYGPGQYTAVLKIGDDYREEFQTGLDVKPYDFYFLQERENNSRGLLFIVAGVSIITSATIAVLLIDLVLRYKHRKNPTFT